MAELDRPACATQLLTRADEQRISLCDELTGIGGELGGVGKDAGADVT
ncbi:MULTISPECIES: hypothetical protein [unclassified Streptomyces]